MVLSNAQYLAVSAQGRLIFGSSTTALCGVCHACTYNQSNHAFTKDEKKGKPQKTKEAYSGRGCTFFSPNFSRWRGSYRIPIGPDVFFTILFVRYLYMNKAMEFCVSGLTYIFSQNVGSWVRKKHWRVTYRYLKHASKRLTKFWHTKNCHQHKHFCHIITRGEFSLFFRNPFVKGGAYTKSTRFQVSVLYAVERTHARVFSRGIKIDHGIWRNNPA